MQWTACCRMLVVFIRLTWSVQLYHATSLRTCFIPDSRSQRQHMPTRHTSVLVDNCQHVNGDIRLSQQRPLPLDSFVDPALQPFLPSTCPPAQAGLHYFRSVLQQIDALGWDEASLSADLSLVVLQLRDAAGRCHRAEVQLPAGFPIAAPTVTIQLPGRFAARWLPGDSLATLTGQIQKALDSYQPLWEQLEDLDCNTQLLDPPSTLAQPYSYCSRCVALGNGASCQVKLSPAAPTALPSSVVFHGPSSIVAALQDKWYSSAHKLWQEHESVRSNLQSILQITVPPPKSGVRKGCAAVLAAVEGAQQQQAQAAASDTEQESDSMDEDGEAGACAICYALHLPDPARPDELGAAPSVSCPAAFCGRVFHAACLAEWLGGIPSSRHVFDTIFGTCPFCQGPIGVSTRMAG